MLELVKPPSLVAKYCKTCKIYGCKVCKFCILLYYAYHKVTKLLVNFGHFVVSVIQFLVHPITLSSALVASKSSWGGSLRLTENSLRSAQAWWPVLELLIDYPVSLGNYLNILEDVPHLGTVPEQGDATADECLLEVLSFFFADPKGLSNSNGSLFSFFCQIYY